MFIMSCYKNVSMVFLRHMLLTLGTLCTNLYKYAIVLNMMLNTHSPLPLSKEDLIISGEKLFFFFCIFILISLQLSFFFHFGLYSFALGHPNGPMRSTVKPRKQEHTFLKNRLTRFL